MKVAIIEDEEEAAENLKNCLLQYGKEFRKDFEIHVFLNSEDFLDSFECQYAILFTDIDMPHVNGLLLAHRVREKDKKVTLVFVTNLTQYAINGYEVDAIDYILKPLTYNQFRLKMKRVLLHTEAMENNSSILVSTSNGKVAIPLDDLVYIESDDHLMTYHLKDSTSIDSFGTMKGLEKNLPSSFYRCNSCYIVNLNYVSGVEKSDVILKDGKHLAISRSRRKDFLVAIQNFFV